MLASTPVCSINSGVVHEDKFIQRKSPVPGVISRVKRSRGEQSFVLGDSHVLRGFGEKWKTEFAQQGAPDIRMKVFG